MKTSLCMASAAALLCAHGAAQQAAEPSVDAPLGRAVPALRGLLDGLLKEVAGSTAPGGRSRWSCARDAWTLLALAGNGSSLRAGPQRGAVKDLTRQLRIAQQEDGRIVEPDGTFARDVHVLAGLALTRMHVESRYKLLNKDAVRTTEATLAAFGAADAAPPTPRELALLAMLADTLGDAAASPSVAALRPRVAALVRRGLAELRPERSRRDAAIRLFAEQVLGGQPPVELVVAQCWPGDLEADPLHTFVAAFALRAADERTKESLWPNARRLLDARRPDGTWVGEDDAEAQLRTALFAATLGMVVPQRESERTDGGR